MFVSKTTVDLSAFVTFSSYTHISMDISTYVYTHIDSYFTGGCVGVDCLKVDY